MPMKDPGDPIKTEIVDALGLNVSKATEILKVPRATLSDRLVTVQKPGCGKVDPIVDTIFCPQ
jgi:plasmid maintenance system antidote protein VapI